MNLDFPKNFGNRAEKVLSSCQKKLDQGWSPAEFTLFSLFVLAGLRSPGSSFLQIDARAQSSSSSLSLQPKKETLDLKFLSRHLKENLPQEIFNSCFAIPLKTLNKFPQDWTLIQLSPYWRWRSVPEMAWKSLLSWHRGDFHLQLRFDIPPPQEVLQLQIEGQRCVSVFCDAKNLGTIHEHDRDAFLFTVHDLEHAWQFFSRPHLFSYQKEWCRLLHSAFILGPWKNFMEPAVSESFHYLISDMNSHPWHAYLTLRHLWRQNWKCKVGVPLQKPLSDEEENLCHQTWHQLLQFWDLAHLEKKEAEEQTHLFLQRITSNKHLFQT